MPPAVNSELFDIDGNSIEIEYWGNEDIFEKIVTAGTHLSRREAAALPAITQLQLTNRIIQLTLDHNDRRRNR